jgi:hypothetical protein
MSEPISTRPEVTPLRDTRWRFLSDDQLETSATVRDLGDDLVDGELASGPIEK